MSQVSAIEGLVRAYERHMRIPWDPQLAGPQKVWFALYEPSQERRLRARIATFKARTEEAGHGWVYHDLTDAFAEWMGVHEYRDAYFRRPADLIDALDEYAEALVERISGALRTEGVDAGTVVALGGIGSFFGLTRTSRVLEGVQDSIQGRLLVFFPGRRDGNNYRLLDARDSWNYLAVPIEA